MKKLILGFFIPVLLIFMFFSQHTLAVNVENADLVNAELKALDQGEIAQVLAPIALYPDSLLTHILIASTYPIEVIEAHRWVEKNPNVDSEDIEKKVEQFEWDPSVVALIAFPTVLEKMSTELSWTQQLGDAFLQDEEQVLATIQTLRAQAQSAGNLEKMENVKVIKEKETIIIEPAEKEVVYVPYYDTRVVYGGWYWAHYPPIYWHYPHHHVVHHHHSPFYWHTGVHISFNFFFSSFHWHNHHVVVHHHHRKPHYRHYHKGYKRSVSHGGYANAKRWHHNPAHRRGVAYKSTTVSHKYHSSRPSKAHTKTVRVQEKKVTKHTSKAYKTTTVTRHQKLNNKMATKHSVKTQKATYKAPKNYANKHNAKPTQGASKKYKSETYKPAQSKDYSQGKTNKPSSKASSHMNKPNKAKPSTSKPSNSKKYSNNQQKRYASHKSTKRSSPSASQRSSKGGSRRHH